MTAKSIKNPFLKKQIFIAFDTETTGIWAAVNRVVEIGAVKFQIGRDNVETFETLINPERLIPEEVTEIHGITNAMVANKETVGPVLNKFIQFCGPDAILIAHNAPFDISFLSCELERTGLKFNDNVILDTVDIARRFYPQLPSYSLLSLARHFEIAAFQDHRALSDALLVWNLFIEMSSEIPPVNNLTDFKKILTTYTMYQWKTEQKELPEEYEPISRAIKNKLSMEIIYTASGKPPQSRIIWPISVQYLGTFFYIIAFCEKAKAERTFRLDRIEHFILLSD